METNIKTKVVRPTYMKWDTNALCNELKALENEVLVIEEVLKTRGFISVYCKECGLLTDMWIWKEEN